MKLRKILAVLVAFAMTLTMFGILASAQAGEPPEVISFGEIQVGEIVTFPQMRAAADDAGFDWPASSVARGGITASGVVRAHGSVTMIFGTAVGQGEVTVRFMDGTQVVFEFTVVPAQTTPIVLNVTTRQRGWTGASPPVWEDALDELGYNRSDVARATTPWIVRERGRGGNSFGQQVLNMNDGQIILVNVTYRSTLADAWIITASRYEFAWFGASLMPLLIPFVMIAQIAGTFCVWIGLERWQEREPEFRF